LKSDVLRAEKLPSEERLVTVIGGSLGAHALNELISDAWEMLLPHTQLTHICGEGDFLKLTEKANLLPLELRKRLSLVPFMTVGLPELFQHSQVVVSRAGGTISELAASQAPTILVPLSTSAQNHQWANARFLEKFGAVEVCDETTISSEELARKILTLQQDTKRMNELSQAIQAFSRPNAAVEMATQLCARIK
jgi:UDP-N-acetylglucosamine--N-acetylmuramyl-(pentapeptide) pyrophosphoryl-undecaprenol N-acetylglucosamine transferase